jgi:phosphatidylserine/phosphatidylglycerophosphate/cardiolipin synthase-like enzyme
MKFLNHSYQIEAELRRLIQSYPVYRWAVGWTSNSGCCKLLLKKREGIQQLVVGLHFYQTHPDFIESFLDCKSVQYIKNVSGVFHPKIYLFEDHKGQWECIIGSPNFTAAAMSKNVEVAILISNEDDAGVHEPMNELIVIKRMQLGSLNRYAGTLLHEAAHALSGAGDISSEFEAALTQSGLFLYDHLIAKSQSVALMLPTLSGTGITPDLLSHVLPSRRVVRCETAPRAA